MALVPAVVSPGAVYLPSSLLLTHLTSINSPFSKFPSIALLRPVSSWGPDCSSNHHFFLPVFPVSTCPNSNHRAIPGRVRQGRMQTPTGLSGLGLQRARSPRTGTGMGLRQKRPSRSREELALQIPLRPKGPPALVRAAQWLRLACCEVGCMQI